jgi:NAD(P)-dependent dehydrogenase (short-subunit alcohol dehydrogenase family)
MNAVMFPEVFSLRGQVALITGGGTGIGRAVAESLHSAGAHVVLVGRREAELTATAQALGERVSTYVYDVTQLDQAPALVQRIEREVGPISCLVNNAGINMKKPAVATTDEEFEKIFRTHVLGSHALVRAVAPGMIERKSGNVLFIASMASLFGLPGVIAYTAAKTAFVGMVKCYATEFSPHGVRVNAIAPGWIDTVMLRKSMEGDPARQQKVLGRTPMAKFGATSDIGWAAMYLASPAAGFVTGVTLPVDGGASIGF